MFEQAGFESKPAWNEKRTDLIQAISFTGPDHLIAFVQGIQRAAAVDSHVVPEPWDMPGYEHPVIMAAGTFIQGEAWSCLQTRRSASLISDTCRADSPIHTSNMA